MLIYGLYDVKFKEQCVCVGSLLDIKRFLGVTARGLDIALEGYIMNNRYKLEFCYKEVEDNERN